MNAAVGRLSTASSISASSTSTSKNPTRSINGSRSAAISGGSRAFSNATIATVKTAPPKSFTVAPGRSAPRSAARGCDEPVQHDRNGRTLGFRGVQSLGVVRADTFLRSGAHEPRRPARARRRAHELTRGCVVRRGASGVRKSPPVNRDRERRTKEESDSAAVCGLRCPAGASAPIPQRAAARRRSDGDRPCPERGRCHREVDAAGTAHDEAEGCARRPSGRRAESWSAWHRANAKRAELELVPLVDLDDVMEAAAAQKGPAPRGRPREPPVEPRERRQVKVIEVAVRDEDRVDIANAARGTKRRRRCTTARRSTGSVSRRVPSRPTTTVLWPSQVSAFSDAMPTHLPDDSSRGVTWHPPGAGDPARGGTARRSGARASASRSELRAPRRSLEPPRRCPQPRESSGGPARAR
jgi:hypothetical protein